MTVGSGCQGVFLEELLGVGIFMGGTGVAPVKSGACKYQGQPRASNGFGRDARNDRPEACATHLKYAYWTVCNTASTTHSTLMPFMQRKSIGHSRRKQGEQGASDFNSRCRQSPGKPGPVNSGDVHRAGIVGQQHAAEFQERHQFAERSLAGEIDGGWRMADGGFDPGRQWLVTFAAEHKPGAICPLLDFLGGGDEAFNRPALGRAVFRSGIQAKYRR